MFELARRNDVAAALRRRRGGSRRLPVHRPAVLPRPLLPGLCRAAHRAGLLRPRRSPISSGPSDRVCATPRSSSTPRPTRRAGSRSARSSQGSRARSTDGAEHGVSSRLILCFLRHLPEEQAMRPCTRPWPSATIVGVGLDSSEVGYPPDKFERVFARAARRGAARRRPRRRGGPARVHLAGAGPAGGRADRPRGALPRGRRLVASPAAEQIP